MGPGSAARVKTKLLRSNQATAQVGWCGVRVCGGQGYFLHMAPTAAVER